MSGERDANVGAASVPLLLSADALAALLQVSKRSLWRLRSAGRLPRPVQLGGSLRWRAAEVQQWVAAGCPSLDEWDARQGQLLNGRF